MSVLTLAISTAKKVKHALKKDIDKKTPVYLSPVRRLERIRTRERVCAMTFDDGPMNLPPNPDNHGGKPLTLVLAEILEKHGGKGTFDVVGDTSKNYPDNPGKHGSASWGGVAYDHYPDINKDAFGGAQNCPQLISRLLSGGHQITNHTYSHILFGKKSVVYGTRKHLDTLEDACEDILRLHRLMEDQYGYTMEYMRPPHYVDKINGGFSSYDACALTGYQYMAASFDGAGWLPCKTYEQEVEATWKPIQNALLNDPNAFCGQIIFQKDGCNMARRTPIADGLDKALEILDSYGYKVITVKELVSRSPFEDLGKGDEHFESALSLLNRGYTIAFRNNKVMPQAELKRGELLMMLYGVKGVSRRIELIRKEKVFNLKDIKPSHPYSGAVSLALEQDACPCENGMFFPDKPVDREYFSHVCRAFFGKSVSVQEPITHGKAIDALATLAKGK